MIQKIRQKVLSYRNKKIKFKYNGSRNQIESFDGIITNCYKNIFLVKTDKFIKSYTYTDILIGILEIDIKEKN